MQHLNLDLKRNVSLKIKFNYMVIVWVLMCIILSCYLEYVNYSGGDFNKKTEILKFFFLLVGAGVGILTIVVQMMTSEKTLAIMQDQVQLDKKKTALLYLSKWDSAEFKEKRHFYRLMREKRNSVGVQDFINAINDPQTENKNNLIDIANFFEDVEQAIIHGIADDAILRNGFQPLVRNINFTFSNWFERLKTDDPQYYSQFTPFFNLLEKWK